MLQALWFQSAASTHKLHKPFSHKAQSCSIQSKVGFFIFVVVAIFGFVFCCCFVLGFCGVSFVFLSKCILISLRNRKIQCKSCTSLKAKPTSCTSLRKTLSWQITALLLKHSFDPGQKNFFLNQGAKQHRPDTQVMVPDKKNLLNEA